MKQKSEHKRKLHLQLETVGDYIRWVASQLNHDSLYFGHGTDNPWDEAAELVYAAINLPSSLQQPIDLCRLSHKERKKVIKWTKQRIIERKPLAYITGRAYFCGHEFLVNEHVLVPRSPIAELIEQQFQPWLRVQPKRILDLCTGSACIGLSIAMAFPDCQVDCSDISVDALSVATNNVERFGLEDKVAIIYSDVFDGIEPQKYDLIVSNPPYVDAEDMASLPDEFRAEPSLGLEAGEDGLVIVDRILQQASDYLTDEGILICEVGNSEQALQEKYPSLPFTWLEFERGGHGIFMLEAAALKQFVSKAP